MAISKALPSEHLTMAERYQNLSTRQVMKYVGVECRQTVWELVKQGKLPKPRYLSAHRPIWQLGELVDYLEDKLEPFDASVRGFKGDPNISTAESQQAKTSTARKLRERFGFGKSNS